MIIMSLHSRAVHGARQAGLALVSFALLALSGCGGGHTPARPALDENGFESLARAVLEETNRLRAAPAHYVQLLQQRRSWYREGVYYPPDSLVGIQTIEGLGAVNEAIAVLKEQPVLARLRWSDALAELARSHVRDSGPRGQVGHRGSNGESFVQRVAKLDPHAGVRVGAENIAYGYRQARDVVLQLVVDDGVPGRGHRKNLLIADLDVGGVACGYHRQYGSMCVAIYGYDKP